MEVDIKDVLKKIDETKVQQVNKVALAYSGGLDSTLLVKLIPKKYGAKEVICVNVDVGQGEEEVKLAEEKARILGIKPIKLDAKEEFTEKWVAKAIMANSDYLGYPVATSMTRQLIAKIVALKAKELGCDAVAEGSTGKGNDQFRMHNVFKLFAPELKVLVPVRDFDFSRIEEEVLCKHWKVPVSDIIRGGDDKTMWCRSIASGAIDLNMEIPEKVWMWYVPPEKAPDKATIVEIEFENGIPVALNGKKMKLAELVPKLNEIGGKNGIGFIDMFEDGIMALKSREIYEAPAAHIILKLHRDLEQYCLSKDEIQFKRYVDMRWAFHVYHGEWFTPVKKELDAFIEASQKFVNGKYKVKLYKGNIIIMERHSDTALFSSELRSLKSKGFNQQDAGPATKIHGLQFELLGKRGGIE